MMTRFILGELWAKRLGLRQCRLEQKNDCMVPVAAIGGMRWNSNLRDALVRMGGERLLESSQVAAISASRRKVPYDFTGQMLSSPSYGAAKAAQCGRRH
jgi:hypothetical protein